jgi:hypothetical protein
MPVSATLKAGDIVRVRDDYPIGHIRTPVYIRGKTGRVEKYFGDFGNPETLAYCLPTDDRPLYKVRFLQSELWPTYSGSARDSVELDLYEHWLEKV